MKLNELTAHEILDLIKTKKTSPSEVYQAVKKQIDTFDKKIKAYIRLAEASGAGNQSNAPLPIPVAIKDNICMKGVETTCSSKILNGFRPAYDAAVITRLRNSGNAFVGQANMDEFAFGSSTENSCHGPTRNPWNLECVPGGSSGGSAAAVAAHETIWALG